VGRCRRRPRVATATRRCGGWSSRRSCCSASRSVNGRLPCPARCSSAPACVDGGDEQPAGGGACTDGYAGYLPGRTLGFQPVDSAGYALDAWNNRIRYAVAQTSSGAQPNHFTNAANLKTNGITTTPPIC
jgi:hypothetical protein